MNCNHKEKHYVVHEGELIEVQHERIEDFKDKIPMIVASIESCIDIDEWNRIYPDKQTISRKEYEHGNRMILKERVLLNKINS